MNATFPILMELFADEIRELKNRVDESSQTIDELNNRIDELSQTIKAQQAIIDELQRKPSFEKTKSDKNIIGNTAFKDIKDNLSRQKSLGRNRIF